MILLFTDFGWNGPYVGQMKAVLQQRAPGIPIIDVMHDAAAFNPKANAYLLNALRSFFPSKSLFLAIVDPAVGTATRRAVVMQADDQWFIGPDNGLFDLVACTADMTRFWEIVWQPEKVSASFHGRDVFAPICADLATGNVQLDQLRELTSLNSTPWPIDLAEIIYIDHYGNAMTGLRSEALTTQQAITIGNTKLTYARTFAEVPLGQPFWYYNSIDMVELAINQGSFANQYHVSIGQTIRPDN